MRRRLSALLAAVLIIGLFVVGQAGARSAAAPPSSTQGHSISWDRYSMSIDNRRVFLWSGEFEYWRLPSPGLWRDVLEKMKAAGFNTVATYFDWDYHSPAPGVYDFSGVRDVDTFLDIAQQVGLYVIARPGPYINAETDGGGLPGWLSNLKGTARTTDPGYLAAVDDWFSHIDPIIARHQLSNGTGSVIATRWRTSSTA